MAKNYFDNIRTVGANLDKGIAKLQDIWDMPQFLLCNRNEEDQVAAKVLIESLRNELRLLKETITENKAAVQNLRETQTQFLEESTKAIKCLKDEVDDIKVLFTENGYVEEAGEDDVSILNKQLASLFVNDGSILLNNTDNERECSVPESSVSESTSMCLDASPKVHKLLLDEQPMQPQYSPYYYKVMKRQ